MDAAGAAALKQRLEEQQHWRQARAVCEGRQSATDPDRDELDELGVGYRLYSFGGGQGRRIIKRLVDGFWQAETGGLDHGRAPLSPEGTCSPPSLEDAAKTDVVSHETQPHTNRRS